jgi:hypothetical protein
MKLPFNLLEKRLQKRLSVPLKKQKTDPTAMVKRTTTMMMMMMTKCQSHRVLRQEVTRKTCISPPKRRLKKARIPGLRFSP